jgi:hypothetical protein
MLNLYCECNERFELRVTTELVREFRPELCAFLRHLDLAHLVEEVWVPLSEASRTLAAVAFEERPWPPQGVGARALRGVAAAVLSGDGQALLTPALLSPAHATNVGLAAALTKLLLEDLVNNRVDWAAMFVNTQSQVVAGELRASGFAPRAARVLSEGAEFVSFAAAPQAVLAQLGLAERRLGDLLALSLDQQHISRLTSFHLALTAGIANYWAGRPGWAEVFPGLIDWVALPPGGITGTSGPGGDVVDPVIVVNG